LVKRSRIEITARILRLAAGQNGIPKTRIMFAAFLSTAQVNDYLRRLYEERLVEYVGKRRYRTTDKGMKLLQSYERLNAMVEIIPASV
jgi:predicted transcriptional regulator